MRGARILALVLTLLLLPLCAGAEFYDTTPPYQQVTQTMVRERPGTGLYLDRSYPQTACPSVDEELRILVDEMTERALPYFPENPVNPQEGAFLNTAASVTRTGESWMSFLVITDILDGREQQYVDMQTRAYDMEEGRRLTLDDILADEEAWAILQQAAREQIAGYYLAEAPDEQILAELTSEDALHAADFTLDTAFLRLHYRADSLYAGHQTIMHVRVPYSSLRGHLTKEAEKQTDNSRWKLVALTLDDGPVRLRTLRLIRNMRNGCANATFFIVGDRIIIGHDLLCMAQDAGFELASHNYHHLYRRQNIGHVIEGRDQLIAELSAVTGTNVSVMRAPGGDERIFIDEHVNLPLINWSIVSNAQNQVVPWPPREAQRLANMIEDGDIVLMHDLHEGIDEVFLTLPQLLAERGFLCVTVDELFAARGIELLPDTVYYDAKAE
ncbi:MAG: polysaccharide deacetylase family protein [Clostridia bacterium]|nr:polysaccharide deacetylase family protein [Clostridia bacterium]